MEFRQSLSVHMPWNKKKKLEEIQEKDMQFIVLFEVIDDGQSSCKGLAKEVPVAFSAYQFTSEPDLHGNPVPCLYWYEAHVAKGCRGLGLGSRMVNIIEATAISASAEACAKIFLTAFKPLAGRNVAHKYRSPIEFYRKHGFCSDPISPSCCLEPKKAREFDYEIMSKALAR